MNPVTLVAKGLLPVIFKIIDQLDTQAFTLLIPHEGKCIQINIESTDPLFLTIANQKLKINPNTTTPDVTISGSMANFLELLLDAEQFSTDKIRLHGDIELAQALFKTFKRIDLDWESALAKIFGHKLATTVMQGMTAKAQWKKDFIKRKSENFQRYLQEESDLLPTQAELDAFLRDVDTLRDDVERFEARLDRFEEAACS